MAASLPQGHHKYKQAVECRGLRDPKAVRSQGLRCGPAADGNSCPRGSYPGYSCSTYPRHIEVFFSFFFLNALSLGWKPTTKMKPDTGLQLAGSGNQVHWLPNPSLLLSGNWSTRKWVETETIYIK